MSTLALGLTAGIAASVGGVALHFRFHRARMTRIRTEADAFGGRLDRAE